MVPGVAGLKPDLGVGRQRGVAHALLVHDDGRLIDADHLAAGSASKGISHPTRFSPAGRLCNRKTPQTAVADYGRPRAIGPSPRRRRRTIGDPGGLVYR
jgi:hypothetical protein